MQLKLVNRPDFFLEVYRLGSALLAIGVAGLISPSSDLALFFCLELNCSLSWMRSLLDSLVKADQASMYLVDAEERRVKLGAIMREILFLI